MPQVVEIQNVGDAGTWQPFVGEETRELLKSKGYTEGTRLTTAGQLILDETYRIMQACGNPDTPSNDEIGIVIGYVQSGKTLSFTTLTALARDNNYQLVIVIAGTSVNLVNQSADRLTKDLRLTTRSDRKWTLLENPSRQDERNTIETTLAQWADESFSRDRCKTIIITVMKNGTHLRTLIQLLQGLQLSQVPTLIIDDEGDQASLNTQARRAARAGIAVEDLTENQVSATYRMITGLRALFPHHTFLQYTATPQANLFINIMDRLSPNCKVIHEGCPWSPFLKDFCCMKHFSFYPMFFDDFLNLPVYGRHFPFIYRYSKIINSIFRVSIINGEFTFVTK